MFKIAIRLLWIIGGLCILLSGAYGLGGRDGFNVAVGTAIIVGVMFDRVVEVIKGG